MTEAIKKRMQNTSSRGLALALLATTQFVLILDIAIVTVALPSIGSDLDFAAADLSWVINAYALTFGGFLLLGGRLGDLYGHRRLFLAGIVLFTLASLACGLSTTQGMLVVARAVQLRHAPALGFELDRSFDHASRIDALLHRPDIARDLDPDDKDDGP